LLDQSPFPQELFPIRILLRLIFPFIQALRKGEPWAYWTLFAVLGLAVIVCLVKFANRPLGGDPEEPLISDDTFRDNKNPYRP
jgi:hypothetical protein